ncbi:cytochrome c1 [Marinibaculum pumilum]|uniref:Cytochrome c1 n=1 Tax=Marinibaculum pumilum TaxID=1766165 RepID=A0ABV7L4X7_9PROT
MRSIHIPARSSMRRSSMRRSVLAAAFFGLAALAAAPLASGPAIAAGEVPEAPNVDWSFSGPFGTYDRAAMQRGFQVYKEVCASCHSLNYVAYRNLADLGFTEAEVKAIAAEYNVQDGPNDDGDMYDRPAQPSDRFVKPFPNPQAARAANGGALPPDLSLLVKARPDGADYTHGVLIGYREAPADFEVPVGQYYNEYFPGHRIAMPPPLSEGQVEYGDGTPATVEQMARDVTHFMTWAAEPKMEDRKRLGVKILIFVAIMTIVFYMAKRKVWRDVH